MKHLFTAFLLAVLVMTGFAQNEPFRNSSLSAHERAEDLLTRLTLEEKINLMMNSSKAIERLNIRTYDWWNEALHGVARAGIATVFPQAIGMAATFDVPAVEQTFSVISDEARAKYHEARRENDYRRYTGLTFWTPNINIFRDPRWGRGQETYGEDPYLTTLMGTAAVNGLQGPKDTRYTKTHACAKHFAVHSGPEWNRHSFNAENIDKRDLEETYLPAFKTLVTKADVREVMCAYNRFEGEPCCDSDQLLIKILREEWGYKYLVVSDCSAINDFFREGHHETHADATEASASAVTSGTDLECGSTYHSLLDAVKQGIISEDKINESLIRLLEARFDLGEMDPDSIVEWSKLPFSIVASEEHRNLSLDMARKSMVMLKNNGILPLSKNSKKILVMGPNANDSIMLLGNYNGTPRASVTILDGIKQKCDDVTYLKGCNITDNKVFDSYFSSLTSPEGNKGMKATYWNNIDKSGEAVTSQNYQAPIFLDAGGATVFAPNVNSSDFSARFEGSFVAQKSGEMVFNLAGCNYKLTVNDDILLKFWDKKDKIKNQGKRTTKIDVEQGKTYNIVIDFFQMNSDAHLEFDFGQYRDIPTQQVIASVADAETVIFVGGISPRYEGEAMKVEYPGFKGGDRTDIELPAIQREIIASLKAAGKRIIFVNCSGSAMAMEPENKICDAIVQAWYPGELGGLAVADVLFGDYNPSGRLPVTFYKSTSQLPDFQDYSMKNRTYRYFTGEPLYQFGYGLSFSKFIYEEPSINKKSIKADETITVSVSILNDSKFDGDEVIQVYLRNENDANGPVKALRAFKRVNIPAGKTIKVELPLSGDQLLWWNEKTQKMDLVKGQFKLLIGGSSSINDLKEVDFEIL